MVKPHKSESKPSNNIKMMSSEHSNKCEKRVYLQNKKKKKKK